MQAPVFESVRFQINLTYRCNLKCKYCILHLDKLGWTEDSDITLEDLELGAKLVKKYNVQGGWLRVSGGEPTLHPKFRECCEVVFNNWGGYKKTVFTNGVNTYPRGIKLNRIVSPPGSYKKVAHSPTMISPADLGIEPAVGFLYPCSQSTRCGRVFDTYGFSYCPNAGAMGRLFDIDPYQSKPVVLGLPDMCQHCLWSISKPIRKSLMNKAVSGKIDYPTKTYREGLERQLDKPTFFKKFKDRVYSC